MRDISFTQDRIIIHTYPYPPATCFPEGQLTPADIIDISLGYPITVRLKVQDVVFLSREFVDEVKGWALRNGVALIDRHDPWSFVLEPFLDTDYTAETHERVLYLLARHGISAGQCEQWRQRFEAAMMSYNFDSMLWEWVHLGATDLLDAHRGVLAKKKYRLEEEDFSALYWLVVGVLFTALEVGS